LPDYGREDLGDDDGPVEAGRGETLAADRYRGPRHGHADGDLVGRELVANKSSINEGRVVGWA
jgi:hypothetical protein